MPKNRNFYSTMKSISLNKTNLKKYDGVLICTDHDNVNYKYILNNSSIIFDSRNVYKSNLDKIIRV